MKKRLLITGGSGFIGRNFLELSTSDYFILAPTRSELDLLDQSSVDRYFDENKIDVVLHCASVGGKRNEKKLTNTLDLNIKMFFNIARNKNKYQKLINLGSGAEYDKSREIKKIAEDDFGTHLPKDDYGLSKYIFSNFIQNEKSFYNLRLFGVFGKYEDYRVKFISNLLCKYILKEPLTMIQDAYFEYIYVDDLVKILEYFIDNDPVERVVNIGTGKSLSLLSIANKINKLDSYSQDIVIKKSGYNREYTCDASRLSKTFVDLDITSFDEALKELYDWYLKNINTINKEFLLKKHE